MQAGDSLLSTQNVFLECPWNESVTVERNKSRCGLTLSGNNWIHGLQSWVQVPLRGQRKDQQSWQVWD